MNAPLLAKDLQPDQALAHVTHSWDASIVAQLQDYIAMPAKSPAFDPQWAAHGWLDKVLLHAATWIEDQKIPGLTLEVVRLPGRTPVLMFEVAATRAASAETILLYGHMDKQPEFDGWRADLGPWTPKIVGDKLYGRGSADDGYAVYASIAAIATLKAQNIPHPRMVGLIETCEESGSGDLLPYIDALRARLGEVALVPHGSPISASGLLFYNTLFDENAACHIALGQCYSKCFLGGADFIPEQKTAQGGNSSIIHVDWMIGSGQVDIDGVAADGSKTPVFRRGEWA